MHSIDKLPKGQFGWAYVRCSSDKQDHDSQIASIKAWANRLGLTITRWFVDTGSRHKAEKRAEFQTMMSALATDAPDFITVEAQTRFGTKPGGYEYGHYIHKLRSFGVELWSAHDSKCLSATDDATVILNAVGSLTTTKEQKERSERSIRGKVFGQRNANKGYYQGGYVPYGCDVVCYGPDGKEKWRVVYYGYFDRVKVTPDGTRTEYNGKGNMPAHDKDDYLMLDRSIETERVKAVQYIFETYATEDISRKALAFRLNEMGISSVFGDGWYDAKLSEMLRNPVYTGKPAWNKRGHGDFLEWAGGTFKDVEWENERAVTGKRRVKAKADHQLPEKPIFEPFVSQEVWDKVQAKVAHVKAGKRAPKNSDLWLAGFLHCAKCKRGMHGWAQHNCYRCGTYATYGPANPAGCTMQRVPHRVIEAIIDRYLSDSGQVVDFLTAAQGRAGGDDLTSRLQAEHDAAIAESEATKAEMFARVKETIPYLDDLFGPGETDWPDGFSLEFTYRQFYGQRRADLAAALKAKDAELDRLVQSYSDSDLPDRAKAKAKERMKAVEAEMEQLEGRLTDLSRKLAGVQRDIAEKAQAVAKARKALAGDNPRRKSEALKGIISKVLCHFVPLDRPVRGCKDRLDRVEIVPILGDIAHYTPEGGPIGETDWPGRG